MAKFKQISYNGSVIIDSSGKISYNAIKNVPASVVDTSNHNHDSLYSSKASIEDRFTTTMNTVQEITKSLTSRPLKTKGYLNGGYKGSTGIKTLRVQRFNATTETGSDMGQISSVTCYYSPGSSSEKVGFFHDMTDRSKSDSITYATETCSTVAGNAPYTINGTLYDLYQQTKIFLTNNSNQWTLLNPVTKTYSGLASASAYTDGRQMLSSATFGYAGGTGSSGFYKYIYATGTSSAAASTGGSGWQMVGVSRNKDVGYWVGFTNANHRINMITDTSTTISVFSINFSESNAVGGDTAAYLMGGYSGGADNTQHGKVQKMIWTTEVASLVIGGDLAYEQSSAGTAEA
jgi:hypothetical protein